MSVALVGCDSGGGDILATPIARLALEQGGHLRVGLEDYVGSDRPTNDELVARAVALCREAPLAVSFAPDR